MALTAIGAVVLADYDHGNPSFNWTGDVSPTGFRGASISGLMPWAQATTLDELSANFDEAVTVSGVTGIPVDIVFTGDLFSPFSGRYLMTSFTMDPTKASTMDASTAPFSFTGFLMGSYA